MSEKIYNCNRFLTCHTQRLLRVSQITTRNFLIIRKVQQIVFRADPKFRKTKCSKVLNLPVMDYFMIQLEAIRHCKHILDN